jgi:hypothetical protein
MLDKNKTTSPDRQPNHSEEIRRRELLAVCRYKFLRLIAMHRPVRLKWQDEKWKWCTGPLTRENVYERGEYPLLYMAGDDRLKFCPPYDWLSCERLMRLGTCLVMCEPVADDWRAVLRKYRLWKLSNDVTHTVTEGKRSSVIFKIGRTLCEAGATDDEIRMVLQESRCFNDKWGRNPKRLRQEVRRIMAWRPR